MFLEGSNCAFRVGLLSPNGVNNYIFVQAHPLGLLSSDENDSDKALTFFEVHAGTIDLPGFVVDTPRFVDTSFCHF